MLDRVIAFALKNRHAVLLMAVVVVGVGAWQAARMPVDVFPDLNRPTVTVMTETAGLAPRDVENLVTRPLESLLNGATGVRRVRSASAVGLSIIWIEFDWDTDIYQDRQIVSEKTQLARSRLPADANPVLAPVSSIMGEIMLVGLRWQDRAESPPAEVQRAMRLRTLAEFEVRNRLLAVEGVAQVSVMGGVLKQYQIITSPERLAAHDITLQQLTEAAEKANVVTGGGIMDGPARESLIRISGQSTTLAEVGETPIVWRDKRAVRIREVADVRFGGPVPRGDGSVLLRDGDMVVGGPAVILTVQKQPGANTLDLDPRLDQELEKLRRELPPGVVVETNIFRQADFIRAATRNVAEAVRDGTVWVFIILLLFLANIRTSAITLTAIPLSILTTALVFRAIGVSINTMTLGGIAVAIGETVDDAIVDVENIFRRLKENRRLEKPKPGLQVIFNASREIRGSIVYATVIVCLVVMPLFALSGVEGRMFAPLGLAYLISLLASLLVSLTVTPVLASFLLPGARFLERPRDSWMLRVLKFLDERLVRWSLRHPRTILSTTVLMSLFSLLMLFEMGSEFLPPFNEGTLTVNVQTEPGTSLTESTRIAKRAETLLLKIPEVVSIARRTGRAELDEHAEGVNSSELDVRLTPSEEQRPGLGFAILRGIPGLRRFGLEPKGRPHDAVVADVRDKLSALANVKINVGQPISHRLDHMTSGIRAQIAVKIFGPDLRDLRNAAQDVQSAIAAIPGVADLQIEPQIEVPELRIRVKRDAAAEYGLAPGDVERLLVTAYKGRAVSVILDQERYFDLVVRYDDASRNDPAAIDRSVIDTPSGRKVALGQVAEVWQTSGPNTLNHEGVQRRVVVSCNVQGRSSGGVVADIQSAVRPIEDRLRLLGAGYRIEIGGQFEARQDAAGRLLILGSLAVVGVFLLLWRCLESWRCALQVILVNLPLAAAGSVFALLLINHPHWHELRESPWWRWPHLWASATTLSLAHWVGFITLIGIVCRNGIMMISHYIHLMKHESEKFSEEMIVRGSLERLAPVLMTASVAIMGLIPLAIGAGEPGKEILHPLAIVVIGGLFVSTLLDQVVTPTVFYHFGKNAYPSPSSDSNQSEWDDRWLLSSTAGK
jgi:CzcA family heavy metal efflux pump